MLLDYNNVVIIKGRGNVIYLDVYLFLVIIVKYLLLVL